MRYVLLLLISCLGLRAQPTHRWVLSLRDQGASARLLPPETPPVLRDQGSGEVLDWASARSTVQASLDRGDAWLVYVHGFAASAASSRVRAETLATGTTGKTHVLLLDWPSGSLFTSAFGLRKSYVRRAYERAGLSGRRFAPLLQGLFWGTEGAAAWKGEVNLVAHSMGGEVGRTLLEALPPGLREVVLIAPCTDTETFAASYGRFRTRFQRLTVYGATVDKVLPSGRRATDGRILGSFNREPRLEGPGIDGVNVTCSYTNWSNLWNQDHFPDGGDFRADIEGVLAHRPAAQRPRLTPACFWYRTPKELRLYHQHVLHLGDWPPCPKTGPEGRVVERPGEGMCPRPVDRGI